MRPRPTQKQLDDDIADVQYFQHQLYLVGTPAYTNPSHLANQLRSLISGMDLQSTLVLIPELVSGFSKNVLKWCTDNDVRYTIESSKWFNKDTNRYQASLLSYKDCIGGYIFLGSDRFSQEYRDYLSNLKKKPVTGLTVVDIGDITTKQTTELCLVEPHQTGLLKNKGYQILNIGLQQYTYMLAKTHIPFIPDYRSYDRFMDGRLSLNDYIETYKDVLRWSQIQHAPYWAHLLRFDKIAICNHRDDTDYDYSHIFMEIVRTYLECNWMDVIIKQPNIEVQYAR